MKVVEPSFSEIKETSLMKKIELAGRTCYKSENLITENSATEFTKRIMSYNHGSVLEHAYLVFKVDYDLYLKVKEANYKFINVSNITYPIVSFNFRAIYNLYLTNDDECLIPFYAYLEKEYPDLFNNKYDSNINITFLNKDDILKLTEEEKDIHLYITIKLVTDRGVTHELVRHRLASYSQESTRYCNYSKDKFSHELTFVETYGMNEETKKIWKDALINAENSYFKMLESGAKPETARSVLPNSLKTEIVVSASLNEWKIIFDLRCHPTAHPDIRLLMVGVKEYFKENKYL